MILVTGGAGFIGSHLVDALSEGHDIRVVDDLSSGKMENLDSSLNRIEFHKMSILSDDVKEVLKGVRVIFHLAAQVNVTRSVEDPFHDLEVNARGLLNLVENAPDLERVVYASSAAVYGEPGYLPIDESHPLEPISPYGVSKLMAEKYLYQYGHNTGLKTTILRYANVYGERQDPYGEGGVVSIFVDKALRGEALDIFGDGLQSRDFVHVSDVVLANLRGMEREGVYNIGSGVETSVKGLVDVIDGILGGGVESYHLPERKGDIRRSLFTVEKAGDGLGWAPAVPIGEGLKRTIEYFRGGV